MFTRMFVGIIVSLILDLLPRRRGHTDDDKCDCF
jgi:hypothetical protein